MINSPTKSADTLTDAIEEATACLGFLYPLSNFIACNSLKGFEDLPFHAAMRAARELFGCRGFLPLADFRAMYESGRISPANLQLAFHKNQRAKAITPSYSKRQFCIAELLDKNAGTDIVETINKQMIKWCNAYLDSTQAQNKPHVNGGFFMFWKNLARYDFSLIFKQVPYSSEVIDYLPENSEDALDGLLSELELKKEQIAAYLTRHAVHLPGITSHLKWRDKEGIEPGILTDYLAIRLYYEKILSQSISRKLYRSVDLALVRSLLEAELGEEVEESEDYGPVWLEAYELNFRDKLLASLKPKDDSTQESKDCQLVFCIDVRSEPVRRELEGTNKYSTFGFAGFFGMAMQLTELGSKLPLDLCPALIKPDKKVREYATGDGASKKLDWQALKTSALLLKKRLKCDLASAFGLVESIGIFSALPLAAKTFFPEFSLGLVDELEQKHAACSPTKLDCSAISVKDRVAMAEGAIKGIGLKQFGKLIVLCGHRSSSVNNPFAASLDCGACGGNGGGASARLAADILNDTEVRLRLVERKILIPSGTLFVAAEHDTTTDEFTVFEPVKVSVEQLRILDELRDDLAIVGQKARAKREKLLPKTCLPKLNAPEIRAKDWAQIAPEWGLVGNAAFIAAPRWVSKDADLESRVFLHSYECDNDPGNKVLELIMTAPLVVAQWINAQYYMSTVDNETLGSGSKVFHNVVGDFGVMQGESSDLKMGLPRQSVMTVEGIRHEPMRLLAVIRAKCSSIDSVLRAHPEVRKLVVNQWIRLVAIEPETGVFFEAEDCEKWFPLHLGSSQVAVDLAMSV